MTNLSSDTLLELAAKVEGAPGPDRELDALVFLACRSFPQRAYDQRNGMRPRGSPELSRIAFLSDGYAPLYSASLDVAMSLAESVSAEWGRPFNLVITTAYGRAYIVPNDGASYGVNDPLKGEAVASGNDFVCRTARAVTAACLRAKAHILTKEPMS